MPAGLYDAARDIAERLRVLGDGEPPQLAINVQLAVPWLENRAGITLAPTPARGAPPRRGEQALVITAAPESRRPFAIRSSVAGSWSAGRLFIGPTVPPAMAG
ncbi:hypothetical protein [Lichenibacterium ramalinae]|uniref:Uncharacterized protein n=1 Tax=Lichenibacterium ramalinae TaxID=2316527 RepID=A0A4Q2RHH4_9HYPH|nr:hypothetical protein [Lichenibacterium ramalinae]RYB07948.1 hypothetical protein D3272_02230 [Lichenibacterium ramalinae]